MKTNCFTLAKAVVMFGLGAWLLLAVINNITDMGTGLYFMKQMFTMSLLKSDPFLGKGVIWRAIYAPFFPEIIMYVIIFLESVATFFLWLASFRLFKAAFLGEYFIEKAILSSNIALIIFISIWLWFLGGDMWFCIWIKSGAVMMMHLTWIMISLLAFIFINYNIHDKLIIRCRC